MDCEMNYLTDCVNYYEEKLNKYLDKNYYINILENREKINRELQILLQAKIFGILVKELKKECKKGKTFAEIPFSLLREKGISLSNKSMKQKIKKTEFALKQAGISAIFVKRFFVVCDCVSNPASKNRGEEYVKLKLELSVSY